MCNPHPLRYFAIFEATGRFGIPRFAAYDDFFPWQFCLRRALVVRFHPCPRHERVDAASKFAVTFRPGKFFLLHPEERVVSPFASHAVRPVVHAPVHCHPAAHACSQNYRKHNVFARARSIRRLRYRQAIRVIRTSHIALRVAPHNR